MKKTKALLIALAAFISLTACGAQTETAETSKPETAQTSEVKTEATEKETTLQTEETTTAETEPAGPVADTAYWDLLCSEYDSAEKNYVMEDGVLYASHVGIDSIWGNMQHGRIKFDTNTKQLDFEAIEWNKLYDKKYYTVDETSRRLVCSDLNGNELKSIALKTPESDVICYNISNLEVCDDGSILIVTSYNYIYLIPSDFSEIKQISINRDIGHGKTEEGYLFDINVKKYKNMLYVMSADDGEFYQVNKNTGESEKLKMDYQILMDSSGVMCGKYLFSNMYAGIFDIETGEKISKMVLNPYAQYYNDSNYFYYDFEGGNQYYVTQNDDGCTEIYKLVLPENYMQFADNQEDYIKKYGELIYTSEKELTEGFPYFINGEYITIRDDVGVFLVNLTTGEEVEITVDITY